MSTLFNRGHYRQIARMVGKTSPPSELEFEIDSWAEMFAKDNPAFDYIKFHEACVDASKERNEANTAKIAIQTHS